MKASEIATKAAELVAGDRQGTHGDKVKNHEAIAWLWNGYLDAKCSSDHHPSGIPYWKPQLDAHDVANMMECLKIARRLNGGFNADDYVDGAGYAACAGEIAARTNGAA